MTTVDEANEIASEVPETAPAPIGGDAHELDHDTYYELAESVLPGGGLGGYAPPREVRFVIRRGEGSRLEDVRGRWYIDYVGGAGALILGHAFPSVVAAVREQAGKGLHYFGTLNEACLLLARELVVAIPCAERVAFTTTGSEATFYCMRIARAFTGRDKILKFEGGYHGNHDYSNFSVTPRAISNYPAGQPETSGIPRSLHSTILVAPYNDLEATRRIVDANRDELAAIIIEPAQRVLFPKPDFLPGLRKICDDNDVLLIFDEVVTGFRLAYGGAQEYFGVKPDIASYGKIIGGGGPVGCIAGRADIVEMCNPERKGHSDYAFVNGTLHGNPMGSAAGLATLAELRRPGFYDRLNARSGDLRKSAQEVLDRHRLPALAIGGASLWQILFAKAPPVSHADIIASDGARTRKLDMECWKRGLYMLPTVRRFVSAVHTDEDFEETVRALDEACRAVK